MKKIAEYKTVTHLDPDALDAKVQELIKKGWQPHGSQSFNDLQYTQVMVKYDDK